jgi:putative transposase
MSAFGSASEDVTRLNQRWEFDSTPADVMLTDGSHTIVQAWMSGRAAAVLRCENIQQRCVSQAIRRAICAWGIPSRRRSTTARTT